MIVANKKHFKMNQDIVKSYSIIELNSCVLFLSIIGESFLSFKSELLIIGKADSKTMSSLHYHTNFRWKIVAQKNSFQICGGDFREFIFIFDVILSLKLKDKKWTHLLNWSSEKALSSFPEPIEKSSNWNLV